MRIRTAERRTGQSGRGWSAACRSAFLLNFSAKTFTVALLVLSSVSLCAQLSQFTRRVWSVSDGLPEPIVQVLAQDRDGFLLVGTSGGLSRFDGARFAPASEQGSPDALPFPIYCLIVARDGSIWAGTEGEGLLHLSGKRLTRFNVESGLADPFVRGLVEDAQGRVWAGTDNGLFVGDGGRFKRVDDPSSATPLAVAAIALDDRQRVWAGGSELVVVEGDRLRKVRLPGAYSHNRVKALLQASDGAFWVGTVGGLLKRTRGQFHAVAGIGATVRSLTQTSDGAIWIGTIGQGIWTAHGGALQRLDRGGMLPSGTVLSIFEDANRRMWIGTQNGLVRLESTTVRVVPLPGGIEADYGTISEAKDGGSWMVVRHLFRVDGRKAERVDRQGFPNSGLRSVFTARDGSLWVGTDGEGAYHRDLSGRVTHLLAPRELTNNFVRVFLQASDGDMWIGTDQGIARVPAHGATTQYTVENGLAQFSIRDLLEDRNRDIWIGTDKGLSHWSGHAFMQDAATVALREEKVWSILEDRRGTLWFGTRDHGLYRYRDGVVERYTVAQGLTSNSIYKVLQDHGGTFWLSGPDSIYSLSEESLDGPYPTTEPLAAAQYQMPYGADGAQVYGGRQPAGYVARDNTVWFPTNRGAAHVLSAVLDATRPPAVRIVGIAQDGKPLPPTDRATILARTTRLDLNYAPLFLGSQRRVRFSYMLEGFDPGWVRAGTAHSATYTNLPPGRFRFRVAAFDTGHPELKSEAVVEIVKERYYYQTWWFRCGSALLALGMVLLGYRLHVQRIKAEFDATLKERARIAREMHDTVIQGCTGVSVLLEALASQHGSAIEGNTLFQHARKQIVTTVDEARDMVWNLRHAEKIDLASSLEALARQASQAFGIEVSYTGAASPGMVAHLAGHEVLMIAREALANSASHGDPDAITMALTQRGEAWVLDIADNGRGFQSDASGAPDRHYGLTGMRERAARIGATLVLRSSPGKGTDISLQLSPKVLSRTSPVKAKA